MVAKAPAPAPAGRPEDPAAHGREATIAALLGEMMGFGPSERMHALRRWPRGPLSLVHLHVLAVLDDGALPMRALAEALDVSQASATGIVDRMEQRGLVSRHRGDGDRRVIRVGLTDAGRDMVRGVAADRRERFAQVLDRLTTEELTGLLRGMRALHVARAQLHAEAQADKAPPGTMGDVT